MAQQGHRASEHTPTQRAGFVSVACIEFPLSTKTHDLEDTPKSVRA